MVMIDGTGLFFQQNFMDLYLNLSGLDCWVQNKACEKDFVSLIVFLI